MVHHQPREEYYTVDRNKMLADIKVALAGYVSERIQYKVTSSGVASDFQKATQIAHDMVWRYGMGTDGIIGDFSSLPKHEVSDDLKRSLNRQTEQILKDCMAEVEETLRKNWSLLERFVQELLKKDELEFDEIDAIFKEYGKERIFTESGA
jgi:ATP-dependent Zn protease